MVAGCVCARSPAPLEISGQKLPAKVPPCLTLCSFRASSIIVRGLQAHSTTLESVGSRGRVIPEPWPSLLVRIALEIEVGLLNSEVQEIFGAEGVTGDELASGPVRPSSRML